MNPNPKVRDGWLPRLVVHAALVQLALFAARPAISYRALDLGVPAAWLGPIAASFALLPLLLAVPSGRWLDHHRAVPVLMAGTLALLGSLAGLAVVATIGGLIALTMTLGLAQLWVVIAAQEILASRSGEEEHDRRFGLFSVGVAVGQFIGPVLLVLAESDGGQGTGMIFVAAAVAAAGAGLLLVGLQLPPTVREPTSTSWLTGLGTVLRNRGVRTAMAGSLITIATVDLLVAYLPAVGQSLGLSAGVVGVLLSLRAGSSIISRALLSRLVRLAGRRVLQTTSLLIGAIAVTGIALAQGPLTLGLALVVAGLALGVVQPLTMALVASSMPAGLQGTALSVRLTGNRLGQLTLPLLAGGVAAALGVTVMLIGTAGLISAVAFLAHHHAPTAPSTTAGDEQ